MEYIRNIEGRVGGPNSILAEISRRVAVFLCDRAVVANESGITGRAHKGTSVIMFRRNVWDLFPATLRFYARCSFPFLFIVF